MKVTIERAALNRALTHVHRVVERRNTIPILSNVALRASGGALTLKATDLDIEIVETVPAEVEVEGGTTAPAHMLTDIVKKMPEGGQVALNLEGGDATLTVRSGRARFQLQVLPEADFPDITAGELTHRLSLPAGALKRLIDKTQFAISQEETRYYLNGIYLHVVKGEGGQVLRAVATDGHRLARIEMPAPEGAPGMPGIIIPRKTIGEIQRLLDDPEAEVGIELSDAKIRFTTGPVVLTSKLIDGTFPDYERVIPANNEKSLTVDKALFRQAVDRVSTISSERARAVKMTIDADSVLFTVTNPDSGNATEEIPAGYADDRMEIGFNARYLLDVADQLDGEEAEFRLADAGSPTLVRDAGGDQPALYVIMPMRV
jgi:DNA polymerase-3 subunit beta